jgi:membrane protein YqaA with SNARE-associated domain
MNLRAKMRTWRMAVADLASHRLAVLWLFIVSATESVFQPIPPDLMLMPMSMTQPRRWVYYAAWCTLASAVGGVCGWLIGYFLFELMEPVLINIPGWTTSYPQVAEQLRRWGAWVVFLSGFTPLPYKFFTVSAGVLAVNLPAFILASVVGRGLRFFLVSWMGSRAGTWAQPKEST